VINTVILSVGKIVGKRIADLVLAAIVLKVTGIDSTLDWQHKN
jgi:hypothetical protein